MSNVGEKFTYGVHGAPSSSSTFTRNYPCLRFVRRRGAQKNLQSARISSNEWKFRSCKQNFVPVYSLPVVRGQAEIKISRFSFFFSFDLDRTNSSPRPRYSNRKGIKRASSEIAREGSENFCALSREAIVEDNLRANEIRSTLSDRFGQHNPFLISGALVPTWPRVIMKRNVAPVHVQFVTDPRPASAQIFAPISLFLLITSFHDRDRIHDKRTIGSREISKDLRKRMEKKWGVVVEGESGGMRTQLEKRDGK